MGWSEAGRHLGLNIAGANVDRARGRRRNLRLTHAEMTYGLLVSSPSFRFSLPGASAAMVFGPGAEVGNQASGAACQPQRAVVGHLPAVRLAGAPVSKASGVFSGSKRLT